MKELKDLINEEEIEKYFEGVILEELTLEYRSKLKQEYEIAHEKRIENSPLKSDYASAMLEELVAKTSMDEFDKELAFALYFNRISLTEALKRGFDSVKSFMEN